MQCADDLLSSCALETCMVLLTSKNSIKENEEEEEKKKNPVPCQEHASNRLLPVPLVPHPHIRLLTQTCVAPGEALQALVCGKGRPETQVDHGASAAE